MCVLYDDVHAVCMCVLGMDSSPFMHRGQRSMSGIFIKTWSLTELGAHQFSSTG